MPWDTSIQTQALARRLKMPKRRTAVFWTFTSIVPDRGRTVCSVRRWKSLAFADRGIGGIHMHLRNRFLVGGKFCRQSLNAFKVHVLNCLMRRSARRPGYSGFSHLCFGGPKRARQQVRRLRKVVLRKRAGKSRGRFDSWSSHFRTHRAQPAFVAWLMFGTFWRKPLANRGNDAILVRHNRPATQRVAVFDKLVRQPQMQQRNAGAKRRQTLYHRARATHDGVFFHGYKVIVVWRPTVRSNRHRWV